MYEKGFYDIKTVETKNKNTRIQDILDLDCRQPIFKPQGTMKIKVGGHSIVRTD